MTRKCVVDKKSISAKLNLANIQKLEFEDQLRYCKEDLDKVDSDDSEVK